MKGAHPKKVGHPRTFTEEEESKFVNCICMLSEFRFPIDETDLRFIVKNYLDRQKRKVKAFQNN